MDARRRLFSSLSEIRVVEAWTRKLCASSSFLGNFCTHFRCRSRSSWGFGEFGRFTPIFVWKIETLLALEEISRWFLDFESRARPGAKFSLPVLIPFKSKLSFISCSGCRVGSRATLLGAAASDLLLLPSFFVFCSPWSNCDFGLTRFDCFAGLFSILRSDG